MKILTWNVNGLRALLRKGMHEWLLAQDADVICLQEIKARQEQIDAEAWRNFSGYQAIWNAAERGGYSGVLTLVRNNMPEHRLGLGIPRFDVEGRLIRSWHGVFWLYNVYFPNGQRDHERLQYKLDFYAALYDEVAGLLAAGEQVVITGDFNTAHKPIDLRNPKENVQTSGFLPEEREWIDRYLALGLRDVYRDLYPERVQYTWWTYRYGARRRNIGWRIDYFLVSAPLAQRVRDVVIHDDVTGSDHCPVALYLE